jgi:phage terminase large subunit-like protein
MYGRTSAEGRVKIRFEQEPGASSEFVVDYFSKEFKGHDIAGVKTGGRNKTERAKPLSKDFQSEKVKMLRGSKNNSNMPRWIATWWKYASQFPKKGVKDDPVDAASGAHFDLNEVLEYECMVDPSKRYGNIERISPQNENGRRNIETRDINFRERHF